MGRVAALILCTAGCLRTGFGVSEGEGLPPDPGALSLEGPVGIVADTCGGPFTVSLIDAEAAAAPVLADTSVELSASTAVSFFPGSDSACLGAGTTAVLIAAGGNTSSFMARTSLAGSTTLHAAALEFDDDLSVSVTAGAPATIEIIEGDGQLGVVGLPVDVDPTVRVLDASGNPVEGATVEFVLSGGELDPPAALTNALGVAGTKCTLAGNIGAQILTATLAGSATSVDFGFTVSHGAAAVVTLSAPASTLADSTVEVSLQARDAFGNPANDAAFQVTLVPGGNATGGGTVTLSNGVGLGSVHDYEAEVVTLSLADDFATGLDLSATAETSFLPLTPGTLDERYGDGGVLVVDIGPSGGAGNALAIDAEGWTIIAGTLSGGTPRFYVARIDDAGAFDDDFGVGGIAEQPRISDEVPSEILLEADGAITVSFFSNTTIGLVRFTADGEPDLCFGDVGCATGGVVRVDQSPRSGEFGRFCAVRDEASGYVLGKTTSVLAADRDLTLVRFDAGGVFDTSFGGTGTALMDLGDDEVLGGLLNTPDGILAVAHTCPGPDCDVFLTRFTAAGVLDTCFGDAECDGSGVVMVTSTPTRDESPRGLVPDAAGRLLIGLYDELGMRLVRRNADGSPDATYDDAFYNHTPNNMVALVVEPEGQAILAGHYYPSSLGAWMVRFAADGGPDACFGDADCAGNGLVTYGPAGSWYDVYTVVAAPRHKLLMFGTSEFYPQVLRYWR